jgi:general secretion pathway protein D
MYPITYIDAYEVVNKIEELSAIDRHTPSAKQRFTKISPSSSPSPIETDALNKEGGILEEEPRFVVLELSNTLLVHATLRQHVWIQSIIDYIDVETPKMAIPYEIYFLENQSPDHLAEVINKIIKETTLEAGDKIEKIVRSADEQIIIVPDELTFSLIVYANKKNQEWIRTLINKLDRRRPQVLIDVTLVEIRKTDEFSYDLDLISSIPDLVETGGQTGSFLVNGQTVVEKLLQPGMRERFMDMESASGAFTGFYADKHINILLSMMQRKDYGRVMAKPKVLVNDNETGTIKTTDTTFVSKKSSIPVSAGSAGDQTTLIETAIEYIGYDAGVALDITPHISEGDLLRLEITLTRSDFGTITGDKPPDKSSNDLKTVVTIPDRSTIILGGMLKLNQTKGRKKVPLLGDLPIVGALFRSAENTDVQTKMYMFIRAEVIRPAEMLATTQADLETISEQNRAAYEAHEKEFQEHAIWPGLEPRITEPQRVLESR